MKLNAKELRTTKIAPEEIKKIKRNPIYIIVDNVLDTYNIGSIFRLADAVAVEEVILCGESLTPPHTRIKKASINTTEVVRWEYRKTAGEAIREIRERREIGEIRVIAIEQNEKSIPHTEAEYNFPVALVVGNESFGVSKEVLDMCDEIVELPMWGVNTSLNVVVSLGIVLYEVMKIKESL